MATCDVRYGSHRMANVRRRRVLSLGALRMLNTEPRATRKRRRLTEIYAMRNLSSHDTVGGFQC